MGNNGTSVGLVGQNGTVCEFIGSMGLNGIKSESMVRLIHLQWVDGRLSPIDSHINHQAPLLSMSIKYYIHSHH